MKKLKRFQSDHISHLDHIQILDDCFKKIETISKKIDVFNKQEVSYRITKVQCQFIKRFISEVSNSLMISLKSKSFSTSEALSRIVIEHSVNLIFILEDSSNHRAESLLNFYFDQSIKKASKWLKYSKKIGHLDSIQAATKKIESLKIVKDKNVKFGESKIQSWPNAFERFKKTGFEGLYHTLYAPASDTVHSLCEDIFNYTVVEFMNPEIQNEIFLAYEAEKTSFGIYLSISAIAIYIEALIRLTEKIKESTIVEELVEVGEKLEQLLKEHELCTHKY